MAGGKDPAVLFYFNDWMGGTATLSRHLKGCYIDLLSVLFNNGPLSLEEIKTVLGSDFGSSWPTLQKKFKCENGLYFNERLQAEKDKRVKYSESRRKNRASHMSLHMESENINNILYLKELPEKDLEEFYNRFDTDKNSIKRKAEDLVNWCEANGKSKKNYRAFLLTALRKDFPERKSKPVTKKVVMIGGKPTVFSQ